LSHFQSILAVMAAFIWRSIFRMGCSVWLTC
jgi:hypothetical protein